MKEVFEKCIPQEENEDIVHLWEPLEFGMDEKYEYVKKGFLFSCFSNVLYYGIAFPILKILTKVVYDLKIEGKENIRTLKKGAITVSNHVLVLDCAMVGLACGMKKIYYTTREESFKIPVVRRLIKLLRAIPIPSDRTNRKYFTQAIEKLLKENKVVHFYPEAALWPYHETIRNFKNGAFHYAVKNQVPIVPMVFQFREPTGIRKFLKKKKDVTLVVLKPIINHIEATDHFDTKQNIENLKQTVQQEMKSKIKENA